MPLFKHAAFHTTVANLNDLPGDSIGEVAFAGRSNAGKSSAINTLADHTRLAYVSKTPGRTQHLNYFNLGEGRYWVDLPGYGFAKAPAEIREQWEGLLAPYLVYRSPLAGLVLIMDSRHPLTELDMRMIDWFVPTGKPIHILLSKADKLTRREQAEVMRQVKGALVDRKLVPEAHCSVQLFSSLSRAGVDEAEKVIAGWLGMDPEESEGETRARRPAAKERPGKVARPRKRNALGWSARTAAKAKTTHQQKPPGNQ